MSILLEVTTRKSSSNGVLVDFTLNANGEIASLTLSEANFVELLGLVGGDKTSYVNSQMTSLTTLSTAIGTKTLVTP
jgi:hypothetical protein